MLTIHDFAKATFEPWPGSPHLPDDATWVDANAPTPAEADFLKRELGVEPPTLEHMQEIEHSSRFYRMGEAICVTIPLPKRETEGEGFQHPLALILAPKALLTVRYEDLTPCEPRYLEEIGVSRGAEGPLGATVALLQSIVDHLSDELELLTSRLGGYSRTIFFQPDKGGSAGVRGAILRSLITNIGRQRQFHSLVEETLLTMARAIPFLQAQLGERLTPEIRARFDGLSRDVDYLSAHETRLSDKIQFLLDASLGLTNVEQNEIFKVLTIVSVIGIPPTLVASMYGMNFKNMPELEWTYGYPYVLALIAASALLPLMWFKWKRWW